MILLAKQLEDLKDLAEAVHRFAGEMERLVRANPPRDWTPTSHPELRRMTTEFERATEIARKAVRAGFMTSAQYARIAKHFAAISAAMRSGAVREAAAEKRGARRVAVAAPRRRR